MGQETATHTIEWSCIARGGLRISSMELAIPPGTEKSALQGIARRCLLAYFEDEDGELQPTVGDTDKKLVPDLVIIRKLADGSEICRWSYVDELIARFRTRDDMLAQAAHG